MKNLLTLTLLILLPAFLSAQVLDDEADKCGTDLKSAAEMYKILGDKWGYGYSDLLLDLNEWGASDYIKLGYIGESTQGREIYELTLTDTTFEESGKHRIYIHARTHPGEVQAFWVTDEMINYLLGDSETAALMRRTCIFHIVPMYNPDGVELEYPRENSNDIDIESNWGSTANHEDEVVNLMNRFEELMYEDNPIEIALNMHSAVACKRYFVYHHSNGTSVDFANMEKDFITDIWNHFPEGMEPYSYYVSWTGGTPDRYPESWWWMNYGDAVMALTYEDMNCESNGDYDKSAFAILNGISDYLELETMAVPGLAYDEIQLRAFPNPFRDMLTVEWNPDREPLSILITDVLGRRIYQSDNMGGQQGSMSLSTSDWSSKTGGIYFLNMVFENRVESIKILKQ